MKIYSGSSNPDLASKLASELGIELGEVELSKFPNGEKRVVIKDKKVGKQAILLQSLSMPADEMIVEMALLSDALTRMGVTELIGVVPWLGYAKQDKVFQTGEPLSVKVVARLLQVAKLSKLVTFDLHNRAIVGFFEIPVIELSAKSKFVQYFGEKLDRENTIVVAPDAGAVKNSTEFANDLGVQVVYMDKKRDLVTGEVEVRGISGSVEGKRIIIIDDNLVTGSTLIETAKELWRAGAKSVRVGVTHHTYVPGTQEKIDKCIEIDELVVTDTIQGPSISVSSVDSVSSVGKKVRRKLKILSVAKLLAEELG